MTNYEYIHTLTAEQLAHVFVLLRLDGAEEDDWVEWMKMTAKEKEWEQILQRKQ